jgi:hypothetical protein
MTNILTISETNISNMMYNTKTSVKQPIKQSVKQVSVKQSSKQSVSGKQNRKRQTYQKSAEYIANRAMVFGANVKTDNKLILKAKSTHNTTDIYDDIDRMLVFGLLFKYFKVKQAENQLALDKKYSNGDIPKHLYEVKKKFYEVNDLYEVEWNGNFECKYWRLAFNKNTDENLTRVLKSYYYFLCNLTETDIRNIKLKQTEHDYQRELLDRLLTD